MNSAKPVDTAVDVGLLGLQTRTTLVAGVIAAAWILFGIARDKLVWSALSATVFYLVVSVLARGIVPAGFQKLVVSPNELTRETPYIKRHIEATRNAWGLDKVAGRDLSGEVQLTIADIQACLAYAADRERHLTVAA